MTAKSESELLYNRKTQILRLMSELKDPKIGTSPTLQQIAEALGISRQRVQQITQMMREDGLLDPLTFELKLPGDKSDHALEEEYILKRMSLSNNYPPMTTAELSVVIGWNKSTLNTVVKRLIECGFVHKSKWPTVVAIYEQPYTVEDYFWSRVDCKDDDQCWPWKESTTQGYGHLTWRGKSDYAHRVAYELTFKEPAPKGRKLHVAHKCRNLLCCNPRHLEIRTPKESAANRKPRNVVR